MAGMVATVCSLSDLCCRTRWSAQVQLAPGPSSPLTHESLQVGRDVRQFVPASVLGAIFALYRPGFQYKAIWMKGRVA